MQINSHAAKAFGDMRTRQAPGDVPLVAGEIFHARYALAMVLNWIVNRCGASLQRALVNLIHIVHVKVERGRSWSTMPSLATTDHHHRVTDSKLGMEAAF